MVVAHGEECSCEVQVHVPKENVGYQDNHCISYVCGLEWDCKQDIIFGEDKYIFLSTYCWAPDL
jgi:hypothetical protein